MDLPHLGGPHLGGEHGLPARRARAHRTLIYGRRLFDLTPGWGGRHPTSVPVFVVTHRVPAGRPRADAPFTFVSEGVESAMAQASHVAGEKTIGVARASITQQCLRAGLLGEIVVALVPVLFGAGIHFFGHLGGTPIMRDTSRVIEGLRVTHLSYRVASH